MDKTLNVSIIYGIATCLSLVLAGGYCAIVRKKENWLIWLYFSVFVANLGYFALSISKTLEEALLANRLAYLGCVFLPLFMMMTIVKVCRLKLPKLVVAISIIISCAIFLIAASPGYLPCYYKEVTLEFVNGTAKLHKIYGPLHTLYYLYLFVFLIGMIGIIAYAIISKRVTSAKHAGLLIVIVCFNDCIWLVEQFIEWNFEFLSISYIASELLLLLLYGMIQDYEEAEQSVLQRINKYQEATRTKADFTTMNAECLELLSAREKDVLKHMLEDKRRKEIAEELCITENTVKKHVSNIFAKLEVSSREELFDKMIQK